jgi:hypothetical protein
VCDYYTFTCLSGQLFSNCFLLDTPTISRAKGRLFRAAHAILTGQPFWGTLLVTYGVQQMTALTQITLSGPVTAGRELDITVTVRAHIEVDAETARRKATGWLVSEVGNLLMGDAPALVIGERAVWRVPVLLTSPSQGIIGTVGSVDVDAQSGQVLGDETLGKRILQDAHEIAGSASSAAE